MKRLLLLLGCSGALLCGADLTGVHTVYLMPMAKGLDQYLANRIASRGVFQVVTDPKLADAVLTDAIGEHFQTRLENISPTPKPPEVEKAPVEATTTPAAAAEPAKAAPAPVAPAPAATAPATTTPATTTPAATAPATTTPAAAAPAPATPADTTPAITVKADTSAPPALKFPVAPVETTVRRKRTHQQEPTAADEASSVLSMFQDTEGKTAPPVSSFSRGKGTIFLVDAKSRQVVWSTFDPSKGTRSRDLDRTASDIVSRLKKDLKPKK